MKEVEGVGLGEIIGENDVFGNNDKLRRLFTKMVKSTVSEGKWFTCCHKIAEEQVDLMKITNKDGITLGQMIRGAYPEMEYRPAIYKYLLRNYLCYLEYPIVTKDYKTGRGAKNSFNKSLVTANIEVVANWMGISIDDAQHDYGARFNYYDEDNECLVPYLRLKRDKEGKNGITKPRKDLDLSMSGTRIVPLFALKEGVELLYNMLLEDSYNVIFSKDSGQVREINTSFNVDLVKGYYGDTDFVRRGIETWFDGEFLANPNLERGYIRVFELGGSIYDTPCRSINYARIQGFKKEEPDLTYMNIDLNSTVEQFTAACQSNLSIMKELKSVIESMETFDVGKPEMPGGKEITTVAQLVQWVENQQILLSTVFVRKLALFMLGNPQWFTDYTGEPKQVAAVSAEDWEDFDDLDIG